MTTSDSDRALLEGVLGDDLPQLQPGTVLGPYRLLEMLGSGGFGEVWRAEHTTTARVAAVKVFKPGQFSPKARLAAAERFRDGATAMQKLDNSPNVIRLFEGPTVTESRLWFAMEYFEHRDLDRWIQKNPEASYELRLKLIGDILGGLQAAHKKGVVHRDVRPGNVLIAEDAQSVRAVLADFDIAYFEDYLRKRETTTEILGRPRYLPPDVFGAARAEIPKKLRRPDNDLHALSVLSLDLLTGGEVSIPERDTKAKLLKLFPRRSPNRAYWLPMGTIRRLASFFAYALQGLAPAFDSVSAFRLAWTGATTSTRSFVPLLGVALATVLATALAFDWACDRWADVFGMRLMASVLAGLFELGAIAGTAGLTSTILAGSIPPWKQRLTALLDARPLWFWGVTIVTALFSLLVIGQCWPTERARSAYVSAAAGCLAVDSKGQIKSWLAAPDRVIVDLKEATALRCHPTTHPKIRGRSILTPALEVEQSGWPSGSAHAVWRSSTNLDVDVSGASLSLSLVGVRTFSEPGASTPPLPSSGPVEVHIPDPATPTRVLVKEKGSDLGASLLENGWLQIDAAQHPLPEYASIEAQAKKDEKRNWKVVVAAERRRELLAVCPEACCKGSPCEEKKDCVARWKCTICRDGPESAKWKIRLEELRVASRDSWSDMKVCISVGDGQNCILAADAGSPLGVFDAHYDAKKAAYMHIVVLGKNRAGIEERIGQVTTSWKLTAENLCEPRRVRDFNDRNGQVESVLFRTFGPSDEETTRHLSERHPASVQRPDPPQTTQEWQSEARLELSQAVSATCDAACRQRRGRKLVALYTSLRADGSQRPDLAALKVPDAVLHHENLAGANLGRADLTEANLEGARLGGADLSGANLHGANLRRATLRMAILNGARLSDANLRFCDLTEADIRGADLVNADLTEAVLDGAQCDAEVALGKDYRCTKGRAHRGPGGEE